MNDIINDTIIPQEIYVSILNRSGFYYRKPLKVIWDNVSRGWRDILKKIFVTKLGLSVKNHSISYSSPEREKVQAWMLGVRCCNYMYKTSPFMSFSNLNEHSLNKNTRKIFEKEIEKVKIEED